MTAAISFDGQRPAEDTPLGIDIATRQFLRAHFRYAQQDKFYCVCPSEAAEPMDPISLLDVPITHLDRRVGVCYGSSEEVQRFKDTIF